MYLLLQKTDFILTSTVSVDKISHKTTYVSFEYTEIPFFYIMKRN